MSRTCLALLLLVGAGLWPDRVYADGAWLDEPLASWNTPGTGIPAVPSRTGTQPDDPRCARLHRLPETAEDAAVSAAGWTLFAAYQAGWGLKLVYGLVDHDGMCRPLGYQEFVFVDGVFAGTISPAPMDSRTDGAEGRTTISAGGDAISAQFARYADTDPSCCPSRMTSVEYRVNREGAAPVIVPVSAYTAPQTP